MIIIGCTFQILLGRYYINYIITRNFPKLQKSKHTLKFFWIVWLLPDPELATRPRVQNKLRWVPIPYSCRDDYLATKYFNDLTRLKIKLKLNQSYIFQKQQKESVNTISTLRSLALFLLLRLSKSHPDHFYKEKKLKILTKKIQVENIYPFPQHDTQKMFPSIVLSGFHISSPSAKRGIKHIIKNKKLTLKPINYPSRYTQTTLKQVLSKEFNVTSTTLTPHPPPPPAQRMLEGNAFIGQWDSNIQRI